MDINSIVIVGRLGRDPEIKYNSNNNAFGKLAVATTRKWKDKQSGQLQEATDWHNIVVSGKDAENAGQYLVKGQEVGIEGYLTTRKYQDKDGKDVYVTEVRATKISYGSKPNGTGQQAGAPANNNQSSRANNGGNNGGRQSNRQAPQQQSQSSGGFGGFDDFDDDIPFD
jgi:single-strand DNA-binding protein